jgi:hypothetical protein
VIAATPPVEDYSMVLKRPLKIRPPIKFKKRSSADEEKAKEIYRQIVADAETHKTDRDRVMADLQRRILEIVPDAATEVKRADVVFNEMDKYITGE